MHRPIRSQLASALLVAGTLLAPAALAAQSDATITITPMYGSWTGTAATHRVLVQITWCIPDESLGTWTVTLDGQSISFYFHPGVGGRLPGVRDH